MARPREESESERGQERKCEREEGKFVFHKEIAGGQFYRNRNANRT